jgi:ribosomal-protein-alanine N-acetyltransferase
VITVERVATARLHGEPIGPEHQSELAAILGDPRVGATLGGVKTPAQVRERIARLHAHWAAHGFGWYAFRDRADGALVAHGGPGNTHIAGRDEVEIGWTVAPERWGQGLATELGEASLEIAFGPLGLVDVVSFTLPTNLASRRVMEKLGFAFERDTIHAGLPHVLYRARTSSARSTSRSVV